MSINAVGIDLGTTNSCVAVFKNGKAEVIANDSGNRITPSFVAFTETGRLIGEAAKNQVDVNPINTVFNVKRLIGQNFDDPKVQEDLKQWPFKVAKAAGGRPMVQVEFKKEIKVMTPEEISSMILADLKKTAEDYLGGPVQNAVITVPAYFNNAQRQATKDAGRIAGFNVLNVLNEPTAAALAYGFDKRKEGNKNILIYDLGGGTFDVTILTLNNGDFVVKATSGDVHLGGEDFDNLIVEHFAKEIKTRFKKDVTEDPKALRRLRTACETVKRNLSIRSESALDLVAFIDGEDFRSKFNSNRFEKLCADLFERTLKPVEDALEQSGLSECEIDDVVLVGGSTRIPKIQKMLSDFFGGKKLSKSINPDEAVACGAAIQAALLDVEKPQLFGPLSFRDVAPLSLGIELVGELMATLIPRNTPIPHKKSHNFTTTKDYQTAVEINVYEGERVRTTDNNLLDSFNLEGITPARRRVPQIEVTFDIDADGILNVSATDTSNGVQNQITITNEKGRLTTEDITRMIEDAEKYKEYDEGQKRRAKAKHELENATYDLKQALEDLDMTEIGADYKKLVEKALLDTNYWLLENPEATKEEIEVCHVKLEEICKLFYETYDIEFSMLENSGDESEDESRDYSHFYQF